MIISIICTLIVVILISAINERIRMDKIREQNRLDRIQTMKEQWAELRQQNIRIQTAAERLHAFQVWRELNKDAPYSEFQQHCTHQ